MIDYGLKDKVGIITGANNPWGIGAATAIAFAREGAKVVLRLVPGVSRQRHQCGSQHPGRRNAAAEKERNARKRVNAISKEPWGARG